MLGLGCRDWQAQYTDKYDDKKCPHDNLVNPQIPSEALIDRVDKATKVGGGLNKVIVSKLLINNGSSMLNRHNLPKLNQNRQFLILLKSAFDWIFLSKQQHSVLSAIYQHAGRCSTCVTLNRVEV